MLVSTWDPLNIEGAFRFDAGKLGHFPGFGDDMAVAFDAGDMAAPQRQGRKGQ